MTQHVYNVLFALLDNPLDYHTSSIELNSRYNNNVKSREHKKTQDGAAWSNPRAKSTRQMIAKLKF